MAQQLRGTEEGIADLECLVTSGAERQLQLPGALGPAAGNATGLRNQMDAEAAEGVDKEPHCLSCLHGACVPSCDHASIIKGDN